MRATRWKALRTCCLALWLLLPVGAQAQAALDATCIAAPELAAKLQPLLPEGITATQALQGVRIRALGADLEAEHAVEVQLPARGAETAALRIVRGESCPSAIDAAIVVIGVWASSAPPPPTPPPTPPPPAAPPAPEPMRVGATLGVALATNLLPSAAPGLEVGALLGWPGLRLTLGARLWPAQSSEPRAMGDVAVEASLWEALLRISSQPLALGPIELGPAAALSLGELSAEGTRTGLSTSRSVLWVRSALELRAGVALFGDRFGAVAALGAAVAWSTPVLAIERGGTRFQPERFSPYASLGLEAMLE